MDELFELLFELIVEGSIEAASNKRVPVWLRAIAVLILGGGYFGLLLISIFVAVTGVQDKDTVLILVGIGMVLLFIVVGFKLIRRIRNKLESQDGRPEL